IINYQLSIINYQLSIINYQLLNTFYKTFFIVIDLLTDNLVVENSKAIKAHDYANQKVILKNIHNVIELEIRNSSAGHYREFLCVCNRDKLMKMLLKLVPIVVRKL
ncbi:MAG: hypothetical protein EBS86_16960, partial [Crocinitomicaceae bacterium]|nr:hypothetical protein [Crocinitomicaceae bacterium]